MVTGLTRALDSLNGAHSFVYGQSEAIRSVNELIAEIAPTDIPVLLFGESGTGKDVYGRLIHRLSRQSEHPLVKLSCTALAPGELLTQMRRAFDGWEAAPSAGTLFVDAIDELDVDCQKVMLAMLQKQEAVASARGVRLISTATRNLDQEITLGRFRRELYFRINGVCVKLPPLRDRKADVLPLAEYFLGKHAGETGKRTPELGDEEADLLRNHDWPGNVRELENLARRMVALGEPRSALGELQVLAGSLAAGSAVPKDAPLKVVAREASRQAERDLILKALERTHWNRKQAAKQLQISYKALLYKIKQMEVPVAELLNEGEKR